LDPVPVPTGGSASTGGASTMISLWFGDMLGSAAAGAGLATTSP
jgi:hypothetical protein